MRKALFCSNCVEQRASGDKAGMCEEICKILASKIGESRDVPDKAARSRVSMIWSRK
jgi:hypothetical protein